MSHPKRTEPRCLWSPVNATRTPMELVPSIGIVEDDAGGVPVARAHRAHTMSEIDAIHAAYTLHRPMMDREHRSITLLQRQHHRPRLHARTLLGHHELAACEIPPRIRQEYRHLQREHMLAVQVLMQAVESPVPYCNSNGVGRCWPLA